MSKNIKYFPILLDVSNCFALVVGAGEIATRKVHNLLEFDIKPDIIAPDVCEEMLKIALENNLNIIQRKYSAGDAIAYNLVFSATGNIEADLLIAKDCEKFGVLLNTADVPELCKFIMPATIKNGDITISIASQGKSPFLVKHLREEIQMNICKNLDVISELASECRKMVIEDELLYSKRAELFDKFLKKNWDSIIEENGKEFAINEMKKLLYQ